MREERPMGPRFTLCVYGRLGDCQAALSVYDPTGQAQVMVEAVNAELARLPRAAVPADARAAALEVLRRLGFGEPDAGGWFERRGA
jgi:hypothetical protein